MQENNGSKRNMKKKFYEKLFSKESYYNSVLLTKEKYDSIIKDIKRIKTFKKKESTRDYRLVERYDVLTVKGCERLINPKSSIEKNVKIYVHADELFEIMYSCHISMDHGGRDRMIKQLRTLYKNITRAQLKMFLDVCESCQRRSDPKIIPERKRITSSLFNCKCKVQFIDFQSQPDGQFKFILVYRDQSTKFIVLKPLSSKRASEVAHVLLDIFLLLGAPRILHLDNGKENTFYNDVTDTLRKMWPELRLVEGKPRHSQDDEDDEDQLANRKIKRMLTTWMADNETNKWSEGLRFVQFMRNHADHLGIKKSPSEAVFGRRKKMALASTILPKEILGSLKDKEDLETLNGSEMLLIKKEASSSMESLSQVTQDPLFEDGELFESPSNNKAIIDADVELPSNSKETMSHIQAELIKRPGEATWIKTEVLKKPKES